MNNMDQAQQLRNIIKKQDRPKTLARVITVTSGKGGVGKSSISVNLAIQLQRMGKRVIVLDADFGLANVEVMLGIMPKYNLADLMFRGKSLKEVVTIAPSDIGFISGGSGIQELVNLSKDQIIYLTHKLGELDELADVIIIDTGAGITDNVLEFVMSSSEVILVTTPEPTSITDAYALLKTLNKKSTFSSDDTLIKVIANRVTYNEEGIELFNKLSVVVNKFLNIQLEFLGTIPQDTNMSKAVMHQKPAILMYPNTASSKAFYELANKLNNPYISNDQFEQKKGISQLFLNLIRTKGQK